jgi:hypothetical protein
MHFIFVELSQAIDKHLVFVYCIDLIVLVSQYVMLLGLNFTDHRVSAVKFLDIFCER